MVLAHGGGRMSAGDAASIPDKRHKNWLPSATVSVSTELFLRRRAAWSRKLTAPPSRMVEKDRVRSSILLIGAPKLHAGPNSIFSLYWDPIRLRANTRPLRLTGKYR